MPYTEIVYEVEADLALITFNRPERRNALSMAMREEACHALDAAEADAAVTAVVLTGAGDRAFISGASIDELKVLTPVEAYLRRFRLDEKITALSKPVLAAINGFCLGGGNEVAMACCIRVASDGARFGQPEINLGFIPGQGGTQRLPRLVGLGRAMELILTGEIIDAAEALRIGLVTHVVPLADLVPFTKDLARKVGSKAPLAVRLAQQAVRASLDLPLADGVDYEKGLFAVLMGTQDKVEGTAAFLEKRSPTFTGR